MILGAEETNLDDTALNQLKDDWEISKQYRVWEANEKLELYPSSYVEPQLRQNKTEIFDALEQTLLQGAIDEDTVKQAVVEYLNKLQQLSELWVEGVARYIAPDNSYIEYCFTAKAAWEKNSYSNRRLKVDMTKLEAKSISAFEWGDWKKANLMFTHQHIYALAPCFAWERLYIMFWFELFETRSETNEKL